jgi:hypothetical protein
VLNFGEVKMLNLLKALRQDEHGVILSTEIVIIGSLLVIGLITGLTCLQKAVNGELRDLAGAIGALDQTYSFSAHRKDGYAGQCCAYTAGSSFLNCENRDQKQTDIVGCAETCVDGHKGNCCQQSGYVSRPEGGAACGSCGGGGCSACGSGHYGAGKNSRCIDTGVPNMKVTEWRGSGHAISEPEVCIPAPQVVVEPVAPVPSHSYEIHHNESIHQPVAPITPMTVPSDVPPVPAAPVADPLPMPMPETQPLPASPMPTAT